MAATRVEPGTSLVDRLAKKLSGPRPDRRRFLSRVTLGATALTVDPLRFLLEPVSAYDAVCGSENTCGEGWSVFCCTINNGSNSCPSGSFVAGWWKSDASAFCGGGPRYIIDCNQSCGSPCSCTCPTGTCDNRRSCCNQFRYGQCHQEITCYGPVRCRMVSCRPPWEVDASCTTASSTDNRTSDHNAPCNDYSPGWPDVGAMPSSGPVVLNHDGRIEAFGLTALGGTLVNVYQFAIGSGWSGWNPIGGTFTTPNGVSVGRNPNGSLQAFVRGSGGQITTTRQGAIGTGWSAFTGLGGSFQSAPQVARNLDGRLEVFAVGTDGKLKHAWQREPGGTTFASWVDFGGSFSGEPVVGATKDGRLIVLCVGTDTKLYAAAQTAPNAGWTPLVALGGTHTGRPAISLDANGTLVAACLDTSNRVVVYVPSGFGWKVSQTIEGELAQPPSFGTNADGRLELFAIDPSGALLHSWQNASGGPFGAWFSLGKPGTSTYTGKPSVISNDDGRLEVFAVAADGRLWHDFQKTRNGPWFGPTYLGGSLAE